MRVAIISDIHANIAALEAVLDDLKHQDIERTYCLGDLVGYAPFPNEVIDRIRQDAIPTIIGNYDDGVGFDRDECGCAYRDPEEQRLGDISLRWTEKTVTPDRKTFLRSLDALIRFDAEGKRFRASSLLSASTTIHALCTPSLQPKSACVRKWEPLSKSTLAARAQATTSDSCGTSRRNLDMGGSLLQGRLEFKDELRSLIAVVRNLTSSSRSTAGYLSRNSV